VIEKKIIGACLLECNGGQGVRLITEYYYE
jgi:hypothetical protein